MFNMKKFLVVKLLLCIFWNIVFIEIYGKRLEQTLFLLLIFVDVYSISIGFITEAFGWVKVKNWIVNIE